jgi:hypothetical protein
MHYFPYLWKPVLDNRRLRGRPHGDGSKWNKLMIKTILQWESESGVDFRNDDAAVFILLKVFLISGGYLVRCPWNGMLYIYT